MSAIAVGDGCTVVSKIPVKFPFEKATLRGVLVSVPASRAGPHALHGGAAATSSRTEAMLADSTHACPVAAAGALPHLPWQEVQPRKEELREIIASPHSVLVYPSPAAVDIQELPLVSERQPPYNLVLLDGTWPQAKAMYHGTPQLQMLRQVKLVGGKTSEYVIRSQPTDGCLSTLETAAQALSIMEDDPELRNILVRPLRALCAFQLKHGAVTHQSTEFRVRNNTYPRQIGRRLNKLLHGNGN